MTLEVSRVFGYKLKSFLRYSTRTDACMEQELEDLQQRFALLEGDRKAFYEQSQVTLKHNKDTADELRAENKDLKQALSALRKERANCNKGVTEAQLEADVSRAEAQLTALRSQHNKLTSANRAKEGQLAAEVCSPTATSCCAVLLGPRQTTS